MSGIDSIIELIDKKTEDRINKIIKRAEDYKTAKINAATEESQKIRAEIETETKREIDMILKRYEASAMLKAKQKILTVKNDLIVRALDEALQQAIELSKKKEFESVIRKLIVESAITLKEPELEIIFPKDNITKIDLKNISKEIENESGLKVNLTISNDTVQASGGVIVRTIDGSKWVDNTIEARFERIEPALRNKIASTLFGEEEKE